MPDLKDKFEKHCSALDTNSAGSVADMSQFVEVPLKSLVLQHPLRYARSALNAAKLRNSSVSPSLKDKFEKHCSALDLDPRSADIGYFVAKVNNIGVEYHPAEEQDRLWIFAATLFTFLMQFDGHFDKPSCTPENVSRLSMEIKTLLRALSRHGLSGFQGNLDDWPTSLPFREPYLWLLKEAEDLRKGAAELLHYTFVDYCLGLEMEVTEWAPDLYRNDTSSWNLDRCYESRKRSRGQTVDLVAPFYIANKWTKKEHFAACIDLFYDVAIITTLANDLLGEKEDLETDHIGMTTLKIAKRSKIAQLHNEKVECLRNDISSLHGDIRRLMEEIEVTTVAAFLWECTRNKLSYSQSD